MHSVVNQHPFITSTLDGLAQNLHEGSADVQKAIADAIGTSDPAAVEAERSRLATQFTAVHDQAANEPSHRDVEYVSRFNLVGLYQSVLSKVFSSIPSLQGYGDGNPIWVVTLIEQGV